jgi:Putative beta barrel porin-7 (BBP7)
MPAAGIFDLSSKNGKSGNPPRRINKYLSLLLDRPLNVNWDFAMTTRLMVALCLTLLMAQPSFAQHQGEESAPTPQTVSVDAGTEAMFVGAESGPACCDTGPRFWATADGLIGWIQRTTLPPLVTTSLPGTSQNTAGVLGQSTTSILFQGPVNDDGRGGFRLGTGYWFDCEHTLGIDAGFWMLGSDSTSFAAASNGDPILARPFFNALTGKQDAQLIAFPSTIISTTGAVKATASSGDYYDWHVDLLGNLVNNCWCRLDGLLGYRYFHYNEGLRVGTAISPSGNGIVPGTEIVTVDQFETKNLFNGIDFGVKTRLTWCDWSLDLLAKAAVGDVVRDVDIRGSQIVTVPGANTVQNTGGLLALKSNIGHHTSNDWTILPEFGATLNWQVCCHVKVSAGYSFLLLEDIARAAEQVDLRVNPNLLPGPGSSTAGPPLPAFNLNKGDVWIQTLSLGMEISF